VPLALVASAPATDPWPAPSEALDNDSQASSTPLSLSLFSPSSPAIPLVPSVLLSYSPTFWTVAGGGSILVLASRLSCVFVKARLARLAEKAILPCSECEHVS
jgi:hypothetical protein